MEISKNINLNYSNGSLSSSTKRGNPTSRRSGQSKAGSLTIKRTISAASYMYRIANARTPSQAAAVMRSAKLDLRFVKTCNSDPSEIKKAADILKRVISKSQQKVQALKAEEKLEYQRKLAEGTNRKRLEERIRKELKQKQKTRNSREAADLADTDTATVSRTTEFKGPSIPSCESSTAPVPSCDISITEAAATGTAIDVTL